MKWLLGFALFSPLLTLNVSTVQGSTVVVIAWLTVLWTQPRQTEGRGLPLAVAPLMGLWLLFIWDSFGVRDPWSATWWVLAWSSAGLAGLYVWRQPQALSLIQRWLAGVGVFLGSINVMSFMSSGERSTVLFNNPNILAGWLLGTCWCSLRLARPWQRGLAFALHVCGIACTGSRAALLSLALTATIYVLIVGGKWLRIVAPALGILVFLSPPIQQRIDRLADDPTAFGRPAWWGIAMQLHRDQPGGLGTRQFGWHAMTYRPAFEGAPVYRYLKGAPGESAHSEWVQLLVDHGWGGPILLLLALALALRRGHRHLLAYGLVALALHGLFDGTFQSEAIRILLVIYFVAVCLTPGSRALRLPAWTAPIALVLFSVPALASLPTGLASWLCRSGTAAFQEARALPKGRRQQERAKEAEKRFRQATTIDPRRARYPGRLAALLTWQYEQGYVAESAALDAQLQALNLAPYRPHRLRQTADLYRRLGQYDFALNLRQKIVQIEPRQAVDRMELARELLQLDRQPEALREMLVALRLEPRYRRAWLDYGATLESESEGAGRQAFARAAALAAEFRAIYCNDERRDCDRHRQAVMSRLEQRMTGDFIHEKDRGGVREP